LTAIHPVGQRLAMDISQETFGRNYSSIRRKLDQRVQTLKHRRERGDDSVRAEFEIVSYSRKNSEAMDVYLIKAARSPIQA
jgi:hypothetical protein